MPSTFSYIGIYITRKEIDTGGSRLWEGIDIKNDQKRERMGRESALPPAAVMAMAAGVLPFSGFSSSIRGLAFDNLIQRFPGLLHFAVQR